jgi:hypothetical protein
MKMDNVWQRFLQLSNITLIQSQFMHFLVVSYKQTNTEIIIGAPQG